MTKFNFFVAILIFCVGCDSGTIKNGAEQKSKAIQNCVINDSSLQDTNYVVFNSDGKDKNDLSSEEIEEIDKAMFEYIEKNELNIKNIKEEYKRQYVPAFKQKNGEREVWVNYFCHSYNNWKKEIVTVFDGGNCFFNFKINLKTKKIYDFIVNGNA